MYTHTHTVIHLPCVNVMFWFHLASHASISFASSRDIISSCRHFKHSQQNAINTEPTQTKNLTSYKLFWKKHRFPLRHSFVLDENEKERRKNWRETDSNAVEKRLLPLLWQQHSIILFMHNAFRANDYYPQWREKMRNHGLKIKRKGRRRRRSKRCKSKNHIKIICDDLQQHCTEHTWKIWTYTYMLELECISIKECPKSTQIGSLFFFYRI